jgi:hypothetical protein
MLTHTRGALLSAFLIAVMLSVPSLFIASACGGDDDSGSSNDPRPSQSGTARAANAPEYDNGSVRSGSLGYSAELPEDWIILPTSVLPRGLQDQYIAPTTGELPATIRVRCLNDTEASTEAALTETTRAHPDATPGPGRVVDGHDAASLRYTAGAAPAETEQEEVVFSNARCTWTISLVTAPGRRDEHLNEFERFLSTFESTP